MESLLAKCFVYMCSLALDLSLVRDLLPLATTTMPVTKVDALRRDTIGRRIQNLCNAGTGPLLSHDFCPDFFTRDSMLDLDPSSPVSGTCRPVTINRVEMENGSVLAHGIMSSGREPFRHPARRVAGGAGTPARPVRTFRDVT